MFVVLLLILQIAFIVYAVVSNTKQSEIISLILRLLSIITAFHLLLKKDKSAYKLSLVFIILLFPVFGGIFYLILHFQMSPKGYRKKLKKIEDLSRKSFCIPDSCYNKASYELKNHLHQINYLQNFAGFPVFEKTETLYLSPGQEKFRVLLGELEKAEHYIFLEYFIIDKGLMWDSILKVLEKKASEGVDVRLIYDDLGCFFTLPREYPQVLAEKGIKCKVFNPFFPLLTVIQNNRDHRKIAVIDGKVAFTGGINLGDEYINAIKKHGEYWKDSSIMLKGHGAWSFTVIFLQMWNFLCKSNENYSDYYPWKNINCTYQNDGFVQPYADSPMDTENVGEHVYLQMINNAKKYIHIVTPYLVVDDSILSALSLAAKSGIEVVIVTPGVADKQFVHLTTRSYYRDLIKAGVRIFEYQNAFIHSKIMIADGECAAIGTTNVDFRSLYLHFECGVWMYKTSAVNQICDDFKNILLNCREIKQQDCTVSPVKKLLQDILRLFAPLM